MKKLFYILAVALIVAICWPMAFLIPELWNRFGRHIDALFGIDSPHTRNYKLQETKNDEKKLTHNTL